MRALALLAPLALLLAALAPSAAASAPPRPICVFLAQDLEYEHYLCVEPTDPSCPAYLKRVSSSNTDITCLATLPVGA